jgi:hypothetical protein
VAAGKGRPCGRFFVGISTFVKVNKVGIDVVPVNASQVVRRVCTILCPLAVESNQDINKPVSWARRIFEMSPGSRSPSRSFSNNISVTSVIVED